MTPTSTPAQASLLSPDDDVATALVDLAAGSSVRVANGSSVHVVALAEAIRAGHKFALRALARGLRIRKYGEFIGRTTRGIDAGEWVHDHNLVTSARHDSHHEHAWYEAPMSPQQVRVLGEPRCHVGECPLYDVDANCLYWIDVRETPAIHRLDLGSNAQTSWPLAEDIGSIALAGRDRLLVALRSGFAFFDCENGTFRAIVDPEPATPQTRLNDGKCDPRGRFWCGSMNPESGIAEGNVYVLGGDLACRRVLDDWLAPNGMTWSLDGATMYIADTRRGVIDAFSFDQEIGNIGDRREFADLGALPGGPDGATLDAEGFLWSAQFGAGCLVRYAPDGSMERVIRLPVSKPTSCAFGGYDFSRLFISTATRGLSAERLHAEPMAGRMLALDVGFSGLPPVPFAASGTAR